MREHIQNIAVIAAKETASFFNSLIAYVVMTVYLLGVGLFLWVFPGNVLETGFAEMNTLFNMGPWLFLFLIPAITMRSFSEEFKTGTIELLSTKPVTNLQIILGKYTAAVFLVKFTLIPTIIFVISLSVISEQTWSLDYGAIIGSYVGLVGLGATFAAIGLFCSSITDNQIIAFIVSVFVCFFAYAGFDYIADMEFLTAVNGEVLNIGLIEHYRSVSRGVLDTRDLLYFLTAITIFILVTYYTLLNKKK
ncbi:MAG: ABC transporter permease subunit [Bacteroidia bacterium]|nr:ABC transporter permease subunit [Bacteroidia bacterium]